MNPLEKLCLDKADELAMMAKFFLAQLPEDSELRLIGPMRLLIVEYTTNRNLLEHMTKALSPENKAESDAH